MRSIPLCVALLLLTLTRGMSQTPGSVDETFDASAITTPAPGELITVGNVLPLKSGKVLIESTSNPNGLRPMYRLMPNGAVDPSFQAPASLWSPFIEEPDGRIMAFDRVGGLLVLRRVEVNGAIDPSFNINLSPNNARIHSVVRQPDGRYLVSGNFTEVDGIVRRGIARLYSNGRLDPTFVPPPQINYLNVTTQVVLQPDGMVIFAVHSASSYLFRMSPTGKLDSSYNVYTSNGTIRHIVCQPDGRLVVVGSFGYIGGSQLANGVARLDLDGTIDGSFITALGGVGIGKSVRQVALQPDGKILIAGDFSSYNGQAVSDAARLNRDGSLDSTFVVGPRKPESNQFLTAALPFDDGKILLSGNFTSIEEHKFPLIARVFGGESPASGQGVAQVAWAELNVNELAGSVKVNVIRTGGNTGTLTVSYTTEDLTGHAGTDYTATSGELTFADGETVKTVEVPVAYNDQIVGQRTFKLNLTGAVGSPSSCLVTIVENDRPSIVSLASTSVAVREDASALDVKILRAESDRDEQSILVQTAPISAAAAVDYTSFSQRVVFGEGELEATVSIPLHPDQLVEGDEQFTVALSQPSEQAQLSSSVSATVTLVDANDIGSIDLSFRPLLAESGYSVRDILVQPDRKILIAGYIQLPDGTRGITRLNPDGSVDPTFQLGFNSNASVVSMALQKDGKILIGGSFSRVGDPTRTSIARLNPDGSLDSTFDAGSHFESRVVRALAIQSDGKVLVSPISPQFDSEALVRLNPDGSIDSSFNSTALGVTKLLVLSDDRILVAFLSAGMNRLLPDGAVDEEFPGNNRPKVNSMSIDPSGRILITYDTRSVGGQITGGVARLLPDGYTDHTFTSHFDDITYAADAQPLSDGKIIVVGGFTRYAGAKQAGVMRLLEDGSLDPGFKVFSDDPTGDSSLANRVVRLHPSGKVLVGGERKRLDGVAQAGIGLLLNEAQPGGFRVAHDTLRSEEGVTAGVPINIQRIAGISGAVSVHYETIDGTAVAGSDYVATSGELEFPEGVDSATIVVPLLDDDDYEHTETFSVRLTGATGGATVNTLGANVTVTIDDQDPGDLTLLTGKYAGVFIASPPIAAKAGKINISLGKQGKFTGTFTLGGRRYAFRGTFDSAGLATIDLGASKLSNTSLQLQLDLVPGTGLITGVIVLDGESIDLDLYRNVFNARTNPAAQKGTYTLLLEPDSVAEAAPTGSGFGLVRVSANSTLRFSGRLADGTPVSSGGYLSSSGKWPVFVPLYSQKGCLVGDVSFSSAPTRDCEGALSWIRPEVSGRSPKPGFTQALNVLGSVFEPAPRTRVVPFSSAVVTVAPIDWGAIERHIAISESNRITVMDGGTESLKLQLSPRTGFLSGIFRDQAGAKRVIQGALLLDENRASGFSTGASGCGSFTLRAE